jgi:hypothetical protein
MSEPRIKYWPFKKYNSSHGVVETAGDDEMVQTISYWSHEKNGKSIA